MLPRLAFCNSFDAKYTPDPFIAVYVQASDQVLSYSPSTAEARMVHSVEDVSTSDGLQDIKQKQEAHEVSNGHADVQSPASTLADTLSLLSLSTPAAVDYKASRLGQPDQSQQAPASVEHPANGEPVGVLEERHDASRAAAAVEPSKPREGDLCVALIYDAIMEAHRGPPGVSVSLRHVLGSILDLWPAFVMNLTVGMETCILYTGQLISRLHRRNPSGVGHDCGQTLTLFTIQ